ncbi:hypothetical protein A2960_05205 [Candidatus Gottesmanbacteria bacterium RIFCSPLOWO2_01_FULL_39_12b]|uniref:Uncharacterized protein n=1 Tax=Candidatus Gottesmanbacteria bacterium RIFCSPLOWO2_01_FULL_39_12b TaxID=1798388 RepID=A0A1F6AM11_9BACT|nr:MAG: hypothetical protein A2960_05205 [Candidatus Gottesmanbacteria bacterium RIFCSPLOWO2_01_FULL_39_12b]
MFYHPDPDNPSLEVFDTADELVSMLLLHNKIVRRGAFYDVLGRTFQGREELEREIREKKRNVIFLTLSDSLYRLQNVLNISWSIFSLSFIDKYFV